MEIEKKYIINDLPLSLESYPCHSIEQAYLCTNPIIRIRRFDEEYVLTYKGEGMMIREESNLPITKDAYEHLKGKRDGHIITKKRYHIPLPQYKNLMIELDVFSSPYPGMMLAEVEFQTEEEALTFLPPYWFGEEVTLNPKYHNSNMIYLPFVM